MDKKLAILGAGANGSCIGADLTQAGYDVVLIDQWPAHVEAMKANGLRITMIRTGEELQIPVKAIHLCELASTKPEFDIVFLVCKSYDTSWMVELIKPYLKSNGVVVSVQNSMNNEWITPILGAERQIACAAELSSEMREPGCIRRNTPQNGSYFAIGELDGKITPRLEEIAGIMGQVGKTEIKTNIWATKWSKLVHSTSSLTVNPIFGTTAKEMRENPRYWRFIVRLGTETARVGEAAGYPLEPAFGLTEADFNCPIEEKVEKILLKIAADLERKPVGQVKIGESRSAILQDLVKGRRTETDYINGYVVRKGREVNVPTPLNEKICSLTKEIEQGQRKYMDRANLKEIEPYL